MVLKTICPPALIYLVFSLTQVSIDTMRGMYNLAFIKIWVAFVFTVLLNYLCLSGLGVISWLIVFITFHINDYNSINVITNVWFRPNKW